VYRAAIVHRQFHNPQEVQVCTLLSVKTGGCPEDCSYCPQVTRYHTNVMPKAMVRLSAGRVRMNLEEQALCFLAGENSIFA
jgi:biotin synthase